MANAFMANGGIMKRLTLCVVFALVGAGQVEGGTFVGLGDLVGGAYTSAAFDVSADGSVVVGRSESASGGEAFIWTVGDGMTGLGDLPGRDFESSARGVPAGPW